MPLTVCIFYKFKLDKFQIILYDGVTGKLKDAENQIVTEFGGIKADLDRQDIFSRMQFDLSSMSVRAYTRYVTYSNWKLGTSSLGKLQSICKEPNMASTLSPGYWLAQCQKRMAALILNQ